jgi:predicted MFS family arabinose efflux permease
MAGNATAPRAPFSARFADWRIWVGVFAVAMPAQITSTCSPFLNGAVMAERAISEDQIGLIRTLEILLSAGIMIYLSAHIVRYPLRAIGFIGAGLMIAGNVAAIAADPLWALGAARLVAGAGQGCLMAAMGGFVAQTQSPHRIGALVSVPVAASAMTASVIVGGISKQFGEDGVFAVIIVGALIGATLLALTPPGKPHAAHERKVTSMISALRSPYVLSYATIFIGSTAVWHFFTGIGARHGLDTPYLGNLNAIVALACVALVPLAALARDHHVRAGVLIALVVFGIGSSSIALSLNKSMFIGAFAMQTLGYAFWTIFGAAVAARLDRTGGLAAAGQGWNALGNAFSPAIGGYLITHVGGYPALGALCIAASIITIALMYFATRNLPPSKGHAGSS